MTLRKTQKSRQWVLATKRKMRDQQQKEVKVLQRVDKIPVNHLREILKRRRLINPNSKAPEDILRNIARSIIIE